MDATMGRTDPVRWWVFDRFCEPVVAPVPDERWRGWEAHYATDVERGKRTTRDLAAVFPAPAGWGRLLAPECAAEWSARLGYGVEHDPTGWGGGVHVTRPGGHLGCHLDFDRHPKLPGRRRALNLILFLHPVWEPDWGGEFYLADPSGRPVVSLLPRPGRLIAFECSDLAYHGAKPTAPSAGDRASAAVYLMAAATERNTRTRALFLPAR